MFVAGGSIKHWGKELKIVGDHCIISSSENENSMDLGLGAGFFISSSVVLNGIEHSIMNAISSTEGPDAVGIWEVLLSNTDFDYSKDFKIHIKVDDNEDDYFIDFNAETGLQTLTDRDMVAIEEYETVSLDSSKFTVFNVIKTQVQKFKEVSRQRRKFGLIFSIIWAVMIALASAYYYYQKLEYDEKTSILAGKRGQSTKLNKDIRHLKDSTIDNDVYYQKAHLRKLSRFVFNPDVVKSASFDLNGSVGDLTIHRGYRDVARAIIATQRLDMKFSSKENQKEKILWKIVKK